MGLTPPHIEEWFYIHQIFEAGLVIQEIVVLLGCFVAYKVKTQISDLSKNGSGFFETSMQYSSIIIFTKVLPSAIILRIWNGLFGKLSPVTY